MGVSDEIMVGTDKVPSETKVSLPTQKIVDGIAAFKQAISWSASGELVTPEFSDDAATIYLHFSTSKTNGSAGFLGKVVLPHCLSTKRNICVVARGMDTEEKSNEMVTLLRGLGVVGEIKTMALSELQAMIRNKETDKLDEWAEKYDTHLSESFARQKVGKNMAPIMDKFQKSVNWFDFGLMSNPKRFGDETLAKADLFVCSSNDGYIMRVGHTGYTVEQLTDNVRAGLDKIDFWTTLFPEGLRHFKAVKLKTGVSAGVALYVNPGEPAEEPPRKVRVVEKGKPPAEGAATEKRGRKRKPKGRPSEYQEPKKLRLADL